MIEGPPKSSRANHSEILMSPDSISVVVPAFNEAGNLPHLYDALAIVLEEQSAPWELVFVDDGSTDETWSVIESLCGDDKRVRGVRLSRNFGHQCALHAGLCHAVGEVVISMDADMQHPPAVIPNLIDEWRRGYKIVNTIRLDPLNIPLLKRLSSRGFYAVFSWLAGVDLRGGMADFRLIDRRVLDEILQFREDPLFFRGVVHWVGYPSTTVTFECGQRLSGKTKYTFRQMLRLAWHGVSSFSIVPLRIGVVVGLGASFLAFCGVIYAIYSKVVAGSAIPGWASTVAILSFLFAILFMYLGLLGEYLGRVMVEVRDRPRYLVSERTGPHENARSAGAFPGQADDG